MKPIPRPAVIAAPDPWSDALDGHGEGLWDWDMASGRVWYSPEYRATLGYAPDAAGFASYADWEARLHPDDRERALADLDAHFRGALPFYYNEHRLRCADGSYRWVAARGRVVARDEAGRPLRMLGTQLDIHLHKLAELALRESEQRLRLIFDEAPIGLTLQSLQRRLLDVNRALCELLGYSRDELLQKHSYELTHDADRAEDERTRRTLLAGQRRTIRQQKRYIARDGSEIAVQVDISLMHDGSGQPQYFITQIQDVRERRRYEDALHDEKELAQVTLASIADAVLRTDTSSRVSFCNEAALRLLGYEHGRQVEGRRFDDVVELYAERGGARIVDAIDQSLRGGEPAAPLAQLRNRRGDLLPVELSLAPLRARDGAALGCVCVLHDVSHTRLLSDQLIHQASHDALTDLPNRRELEAELAHWLSTARLGVCRHTLLYLDLDHFKLINETAGHSVGDRAVCTVAQALRKSLPDSAVLARTGGDEFAILLPHSTLAEAKAVGDALIAAIELLRFEHEGRPYQLGASVGISVIDAGTRDANSVLAQADTACYIAKRQGGNRCQVYHSGDESVREAFRDSDWASRIQDALESGKVLLYGQRIVPLRSELPPDYEVLIRIRDSDGSLQRPAAFLTAAERYGLSGRVDRWVVEHTLGALARHLPRGENPPFGHVSINLTGHSVSDSAFGDFLFEALARHAIPPHLLSFEITEGTALMSFAAARRLLARLRESGCRVMLDDFGSGFTSFDYLRQMTVDGLKIDQTYTQRLQQDPLNQTIVDAIRRIGSVLGIEIVAEGVEDESTLALLRRLDIDAAQGHLFHVASPLEELLAG